MLRLLPGEETIFELRVVNHGDPANISVDASPHLIKAMRLKRANHHVEVEERIPVLARMPDNLERLDGEILVISERGTSRVPISLISEGSGEDEEDLDDENIEKSSMLDLENEDKEDDGENSRELFGADEVDGEKIQDAQDAYFDGQKDVEDYRSAMRRKSPSAGRMASGHRKPQHYNSSFSYETAGTWNEVSSTRDPEHNADHIEENAAPSGSYYPRDGDGSIQDASYQGSEDVEDDGVEDDDLWGLHRALNLIQIAPLAMLILIIAVLILTFYTATIPEFLGALASSILIVTLIIYGAATLLKA